METGVQFTSAKVTRPRFSIGIDLGTTNCVLSYVDLRVKNSPPQVLPIPQRQSLTTVGRGLLLPSFYYFVAESECAGLDASEQAGSGAIVGAYARTQMTATPGRVIHAAKSWLAHRGIDREAKILPFGSEEVPDAEKLSPVEASASYLAYLKMAWDMAFVDDLFNGQRITITVPASFDEGAQALTRQAACLAGYPDDVRLLEEPQAAFYSWTEATAASKRSATMAAAFIETLPDLALRDQTVLVCDIGGGTTDLSLFRLARAPTDFLDIERIAVSDHLLLGGDNIDLAIAHALERQVLGDPPRARLSRRQWQHLVPQAAVLKERLLETEGPGEAIFHVSVPGEGSSLFASALSATLSRGQLHELILEGFFPYTERGDRPRARQIGLREIGLLYAADSAVSRHLAGFLNGAEVQAVLFAGGTLSPRFLQEQVLSIIGVWQEQRPAGLTLPDMSSAIAQGAAYFGALAARSRRRIRAGYARSVYLELQRGEGAAIPNLICVLPQGFQEGGRVSIASHSFKLLLNKPVRFTAYTSTHRSGDRPGAIVRLTEGDFSPLPLLYTTLTLADRDFDPRTARELNVAVTLDVELNALGILQLALVNRDRSKRWRLEFNLRSAGAESLHQTVANDAGVAPEAVADGIERIERFYGKKQNVAEKEDVKGLVKDLERIFSQERAQWNLFLLRSLWQALYPGMTRRGRSLAHENTWLYLAGFTLRPGFGGELDAWRMAQIWGCFNLGLSHKKEKSAQSNWWMMWRRVAGGLSAEQQMSLYTKALPLLKRGPQEFSEGTRLLGSLERLPVSEKTELVEYLFDLLLKGKARNQPHLFWTLARLLSRVPLYTSADTVIPATVVEEYFLKLRALRWKRQGLQPLVAVFSSACRVTDARALDIHDRIREEVVEKLKREGAKELQWQIVREHHPVSSEERNFLFGEELPVGLQLVDGDV
ncbi:MAG: Hsp70 family protein [Chromatiales bacterium]